MTDAHPDDPRAKNPTNASRAVLLPRWHERRRSGRRSRKSRPRPLRWRIEWAAVRTGVFLLNVLPEPVARALSDCFGCVAYYLVPRWRRRALANLRRVFPQWSEGQRRAFARRNLRELGRAAGDWARLPSVPPEELLRRVEFVGLEHLETALRKGKGVLAVTGHLGLWELIPAAIRLRLPGLEICVVGRVLRNPYLQRMIVERRRIGAQSVLPPNLWKICRAVRRGAAVGLLVDQYTSPRRGGILSPFMGNLAWTTRGPTTIALRTGAAVLPVHVLRVRGSRYRIEIGPEIEIDRSGDRERDTTQGTARINAALAHVVRNRPEQWVWFHRRWRPSSRDRHQTRRTAAGSGSR